VTYLRFRFARVRAAFFADRERDPALRFRAARCA
jgi:hypothetical protein